jgi:hypothetical protein
MYKSTPITKKAKTAGEYNSALKQTQGISEQSTSVTPGTIGETITGRRKKKSVIDFEQKCYNADGSRKRGVAGCTWADEEGTESPEEFETFTEQKPGTPDVVDIVQEYKPQQRRVLGDLETRELNRTTKKTEKDLRRVKIKEAREARKQAKADGTSRKERRKDFKQSKRTAKQEEIANEKAAFETRSKLNREAQAFGRKAGEAYEIDVPKTKSDFTKEELIQNKRNKNRLAAQSIGQMLTGFPMRAPMKKNYFKK